MHNTLREIAKESIRFAAREHGTDILVEKKISPVIEGTSSSQKVCVLNVLQEQYARCLQCPLATTRINVVFGTGNPNAKLMFVGEGPGYDEDHEGKPFVGKAGMLLTKIIEAINLTREMVYITNVVKCHPLADPKYPEKRGNDRKPEQNEITACLSILEQQVDIIQPKVICALGAVAAQTLTSTSRGIQAVRGKEFIYRGITVIPTFHPAYLLRTPAAKKETWEDMKKIRDMLKKIDQ